MTHEQYIELETAKLAKQAGFDWECRGYYYMRPINDYFELIDGSSYTDNKMWKGIDTILSAPTQSVLQRWLRDVKGWEVYVEVKYGNNKEYVCRIETSEYGCNTDFYSTYEAALEAGLQKRLTLLIEKQ